MRWHTTPLETQTGQGQRSKATASCCHRGDLCSREGHLGPARLSASPRSHAVLVITWTLTASGPQSCWLRLMTIARLWDEIDAGDSW